MPPLGVSEATLYGRVRLGSFTEDQLTGRAFIKRSQPDLDTDGDGHYIRDGNGDYIVLGVWDASQLQGFIEVDTAIMDAALPRLGARQQIADIQVDLISSTAPTISNLRILPAVSIDMELGQPTRWSFALPYREFDPLDPTVSTRVLPSPVNVPFLSTLEYSVRIRGVYLTDEGRAETVLVHLGHPLGTPLRGRAGQSTLTIEGGDVLVHEHGHVTFSLPPGSGLPRGVVAKMVTDLGAAGNTHSLWSGTPMYRDFQVAGSWLHAVHELADADNRLLWINSTDGDLLALPEVDQSSPIAMVIGPRDIADSEDVEIETPSAPYAEVRISGTQQVLRDGVSVRTTPPSIAKAYSRYRVKTALATQNSAGVVSSTGLSEGDDDLKLTSQTSTRLTYEGDTLLVEETEFEAYYNPEVWRYNLVGDPDGVDGGGDYDAYNGGAYFYDAGTTKNDNTPAYRWNRERFGLVGRQRTTHTYDDRNFLISSETIREGYLTLQQAIKTRANKATTFEATNHNTVNILGGGIAAKGQISSQDGERFVGTIGGFTAGGADKLERIRIEHNVTDDGYVTATTTTTERWDAIPGASSRYYYGDGSQRDSEEFEFIEAEKIVEQYYAEGESARRATSRFKYGEIVEVIDEPIDGYFPVATQRVDIVPPASLYDGRPELAGNARAASRHEGKPIQAHVSFSALNRQISPLEETFDRAENQADLDARAAVRLALHSARTVTWAMPANWLMKPGMRVHLRFPSTDIDHDVHVIAVTHERAGLSDPYLTRCRGRIYVVA